MNCEITKLIIIIPCDKHSSERKQRAGAPTQLWRERGFVKEEKSELFFQLAIAVQQTPSKLSA